MIGIGKTVVIAWFSLLVHAWTSNGPVPKLVESCEEVGKKSGTQ
jgi:hypothetical protein